MLISRVAQMKNAVLEQAAVQHVERCLAGEQAAHLLLPSAYDCRHAVEILHKHFPRIAITGPPGALPPLPTPTPPLGTIMVGSITGMCIEYLRTRALRPQEAGDFHRAIALVVNYDPQMEHCVCHLADSSDRRLDSIELGAFLAAYQATTIVTVELAPELPRWDYAAKKPVY